MATFADDLSSVGQPNETIQERLARVRAEAAARRRALEAKGGPLMQSTEWGPRRQPMPEQAPASRSVAPASSSGEPLDISFLLNGGAASLRTPAMGAASSPSQSTPFGSREQPRLNVKPNGEGRSFVEGVGDWLGNAGSNVGNWLGGLFSGGGQQPSAKPKPAKPAPGTKPPKPARAAQVDGGMEVEPLFGKTLADYLAEANASQFSAGALSDIAAREAALKNQAGASDDLMARAYAAVVQGMQAQDPAIQARYDEARADTDAATQRAVDLANSATTDSLGNINQTAQNLGITEALPGATGNGNGPGGVNANLVAQLAGYGQLSGQSLIDSAANQRTYNANIGSATNVQGAESRAALQRDLMAYLAQLQDERTQVNAAAQSQALDLARALYEADYGQARDQREYEAGIDGAAYDTALAQAKLVNDTKRADAALLSAQGRSQQQAKGIMGIEDSLIARGIPADVVQQGLNVIAVQPANNDPVRWRKNAMLALAEAGVDPKYIPFLAMAAEEFYQQYRS